MLFLEFSIRFFFLSDGSSVLDGSLLDGFVVEGTCR